MKEALAVAVEEVGQGSALVLTRCLLYDDANGHRFVVQISFVRFLVGGLRIELTSFVMTYEINRRAQLVRHRVTNELCAVHSGDFRFFLVRPVNKGETRASIRVGVRSRAVLHELLRAIRFTIARFGEEVEVYV